ncbi:hypothetical protein ACP4OV_011873 [Aristida adscensionis]
MEICLSAFLGELISGSINFFINRSLKPPALDVEDRLRRTLLRAEVILDEAMGRAITNRAMLQQLDMLRGAMHRGYYTLDTFRYKYHDKEESKDQVVSSPSSFLLSKVNSAKDLCFSGETSSTKMILGEMQEVLADLSSMILDANELVLLLTSYPRMCREPYSMHLLLNKCMFGRQMETELVISFLLCRQARDSEDLEILPIVGPGRIGKTTLVAHVCNDERVRDHFSEIMFLSSQEDFRYGDLTTCTVKKYGRVLVVVEVDGEIDEGVWKRLCSSCKQCMASGSKIIITSRSDSITNLGTTRALTMKSLSQEAYWYFFKTLTFGSTNPEMHPKLACLAMEIARVMNGSLISANITACFLRDNFDIHIWCKVLAFLKGLIQKHVSKFGRHPSDVVNQNGPAHLGRMCGSLEDLLVHHQYQRPSQEEVPRITLEAVIYGNLQPPGKFEVLAWRSQIPPYHSYIYTCEIRGIKTAPAKRKRAMRNGVTLS